MKWEMATTALFTAIGRFCGAGNNGASPSHTSALPACVPGAHRMVEATAKWEAPVFGRLPRIDELLPDAWSPPTAEA